MDVIYYYLPALETIRDFLELGGNVLYVIGILVLILALLSSPFLLVVFFTYFYTAIQFDPERQAEMIQRQGGFIPGIRPGEPCEISRFEVTKISEE